MGFRKWFIEALGGTTMNANSLANLKQNRTTTAQTEDAPSAPAKTARSDEDFIDKMMKFENLRQKIYETEQAKRNAIVSEVQAQFETQQEAFEEDEEDGAAEQMFGDFLSKLGGTQQQPQQQQLPRWDDAAPPPVYAPAPQPAAAPSVDQIAAQIPAKYVKGIKSGKISEDQAIEYATQQGIDAATAKQVYLKVKGGA